MFPLLLIYLINEIGKYMQRSCSRSKCYKNLEFIRDFEQPDLVEGVSAHGRRVGTR